MRDSIVNVQPAVAGESVVERDPAEGESLGGAGTLEVFIQRGSMRRTSAYPAVTGHNEGRQIIFVTEPIHHI